ncbi:hypothetical protein Tsubulata_013692 [Turnera subulata]|uniref:Zinc knuckle CX2CX4HX4C domain-containing protein n=1 Tax=Turnera subulata TaxID=218843 RepID=A0A9Q0G8G6_9ROSI|nr:hypothetical protein Tsubulata_013692 [Turnera subulata]
MVGFKHAFLLEGMVPGHDPLPSSQALFWVQIHDIPPNLLTHDHVVKIGAVFLVFHFYEPTLEAMLGWQGCIRARVEIETDIPLIPGVACLDQAGREIWIKFKYERLGELCIRCGRITHPTGRCTKPIRLNEGVERPAEDSFGPWLRAREVFGKYYPARKQIPLDAIDENQGDDEQNAEGGDGRTSPTPSITTGPCVGTVSKKRKMVKEEELQSPIKDSARRDHTGLMNTVAELVTDLRDFDPIHAFASRPTWNKMARRARIDYEPTTVELIQSFEATMEGTDLNTCREPRVDQEGWTSTPEPLCPDNKFHGFDSLVYAREEGGSIRRVILWMSSPLAWKVHTGDGLIMFFLCFSGEKLKVLHTRVVNLLCRCSPAHGKHAPWNGSLL